MLDTEVNMCDPSEHKLQWHTYAAIPTQPKLTSSKTGTVDSISTANYNSALGQEIKQASGLHKSKSAISEILL